MKFKFSLLICILLFLQLTAQTPVLTIGSPDEVGISSERLERIDKMLHSSIEDEQIPGVVALIARDGKIVYHKAFGSADAGGKELKKDDIFRIASQTKAITATAVMMLWEEGKFRLDDPVSKYIPEFKDMGVLETFSENDSTFTVESAKKEISIRHLLTHTSGIGYGMIDGDDRFRKIYVKNDIIDAFTTKDIDLKKNITKLAQMPLHHTPGEKFTYSEGLDVLGYLVEIISGKSFDQFLKERIFDPLEMNDTHFYLPASKNERLVKVQMKKDGEWKNFPENEYYDPEYPIRGAKAYFSGGAGLSSTASDYAKFLQMYLNGGSFNGNMLLSPMTVEVIMSNHTEDLFKSPGKYYGLAFGIVSERGEDIGGMGSEGTFNWGGYFNTQYFADPVTNVIGILLKQTQGTREDETGWKFRQMVFASLIE
ncbi:serine hydrolase [Gramella sp. KN1008]|uniref:serine hydrolase domain-containing protein n=1 Tax=Gramella sp. KN1008 TaxID=2529298 RepID=UPI00103AFB83|nr:serine hydrolase domain-containing protein [Gramella sp. KN1008]TBW29080.1 class A beta-lactamase-related serine hydrolase [Gramella sp. KN1008]